jgi:hypothetical protein
MNKHLQTQQQSDQPVRNLRQRQRSVIAQHYRKYRHQKFLLRQHRFHRTYHKQLVLAEAGQKMVRRTHHPQAPQVSPPQRT